MNDVGILQGRLSRPGASAQTFPWAAWAEEFAAARACGFTCLEWLVTDEGLEQNPLWSDAGATRLRALVTGTGVSVRSLCADVFIRRPFVRAPEDDRRASAVWLERLVTRAAQLGIEVVLVPLLEHGAIASTAEAATLPSTLGQAVALAEASGVRLGLETDLPCEAARALVESFASPAVGVYYDLGNAASLGYDVAADLRQLDPVLCGIHVKDRRRGGPSVPLGHGDVDFAATWRAVRALAYRGPLILETPPGADPRVSARDHLAFVRSGLHAASPVAS